MIKPLYNNVLVKILEPEIIIKQGLIIQNNQNEEIKLGEIIRLSDGFKNIYIKEKMKILFNINESNKMFYSNQNYFLIDSNKILGIIEEEKL